MSAPKFFLPLSSIAFTFVGALLLTAIPVEAAGPSISEVYPVTAAANVPVTFSATVSTSNGIASCKLYVDLEDLGAMTISGNTASKSYTFSSGGSHIAFVFCRDNNSGMSAGANTAIWVTGAIQQTSPFAGDQSSTPPPVSFPQNNVPPPVIVTPPPLTPSVVEAPAPSPGMLHMGSLIKLTCADGALADDICHVVYYYGADGKRHAFPNSKVYFTWYTNFDAVLSVDGAVMGQIPLAKNVTYRPGVRMVKFQTLNRVYAVSKGGVLRWITTEVVARNLYGEDWNKKIDDIPDTFYTNYVFGSDITVTGDYSTMTELDAAKTIDASL